MFVGKRDKNQLPRAAENERKKNDGKGTKLMRAWVPVPRLRGWKESPREAGRARQKNMTVEGGREGGNADQNGRE